MFRFSSPVEGAVFIVNRNFTNSTHEYTSVHLKTLILVKYYIIVEESWTEETLRSAHLIVITAWLVS